MKPALFQLVIIAFFVPGLCGQESTLVADPPKGMTPEQVILRFTAKEKDFKNARKKCSYRQTVRFQTLQGVESTSEYRQVTDVRLDANGNKVKSTVLSPQSSMQLSPEDEADIESRLHFTLSTDELPEYNVTYKGQQQEDDLHTYVFEVAPKVTQEGKRYFKGTVWVDDHDFQIVKTTGKSFPDILPKKKKQQPNLFPQFTTWRELRYGYWFPTYSLTDDVLHFPAADVHLVGTVKATNLNCGGPESAESQRVEPSASDKSRH
jgi:outer membrane lipoprotein-sorting protein